MPTVSVIVPTFNRASVLPRAIESVLNQTYDDFELIIVDDASTDDTESVVTNFDRDEINYIKLQENKGANAARNRGIHEAHGEFISFLDSDDEYLPHRLETSVNVLKQSSDSIVGVFHSYEYVQDGEIQNISHVPKKKVELKDLISENLIGGLSCTMFRSKVIKEIGGLDESLPSSQDYDLYLRIAQNYDIIGIPEILSKYYSNEEGIRDNYDLICEGQDRLLNKHKDILSDERISRHHYSRAFYHASKGEISDTQEELRTSIWIYPYNPLYYYHYISSFGGKRVFNIAKNFKIRVKTFLRSI